MLHSTCTCYRLSRCWFSDLKFEVLQNLPEQERIAPLRSVEKRLSPVITETITDWGRNIFIRLFVRTETQNELSSTGSCRGLPVLESVGGLVEQSMIRSQGASSEMAGHREAVAVSCWDRPGKPAALMNLVQNTTGI